MKFRLHYFLINALIRIWPQLFQRYYQEYFDTYSDYVTSKFERGEEEDLYRGGLQDRYE